MFSSTCRAETQPSQIHSRELEGEEARIFEARQQAEILSLLVTQVESKRQILIPIAAQVEEERFRKPGLGTKRYSVQ
jgi:hypothetical protein